MPNDEEYISQIPDSKIPRKPRQQKHVTVRAIRRQLSNMPAAMINPQSDSLFFNKLPAEIRLNIYEEVFAQREDTDNPDSAYANGAWHYRPGLRYKNITETTFILSCRRVYQEASSLPMRLATFHAWYEPKRGPRHYAGTLAARKKDGHGYFRPNLARFTQKNIEEFEHAHLFVQMCFLDGLPAFNRAPRPRAKDQELYSTLRDSRFVPKRLTITIRHTDWWWWEDNIPLVMKEDWRTKIRLPDTCRRFTIELETIATKKTQLDRIVSSMRTWQFQSFSGHILENDGAEPKVSSWTGNAKIMGVKYPLVHGNAENLDYYVVTLNWRQKKEADMHVG